MITIGQQFQDERKRKNLTLEEISKATKIRTEFLDAIEKGEYKKLPGASYTQGFVRNYAKFLDLPIEKSLAIFRREFNAEKSFEVLPKGFQAFSEMPIGRFRIGRNALIIAGVFLILIIFILFQYRAAFLNPSLDISTPKDNEIVKSLTVSVKGKTEPNTTLFVEGEAVVVNPDGSFSSEISLFPGKGTLSFIVENRFGRKTQKSLNILIKP